MLAVGFLLIAGRLPDHVKCSWLVRRDFYPFDERTKSLRCASDAFIFAVVDSCFRAGTNCVGGDLPVAIK